MLAVWLLRNIGGNGLKHRFTVEQRKELQTKMARALGKNIKGLSTELQKILLDDLVTAFQNRIDVLVTAQEERRY